MSRDLHTMNWPIFTTNDKRQIQRWTTTFLFLKSNDGRRQNTMIDFVQMELTTLKKVHISNNWQTYSPSLEWLHKLNVWTVSLTLSPSVTGRSVSLNFLCCSSPSNRDHFHNIELEGKQETDFVLLSFADVNRLDEQTMHFTLKKKQSFAVEFDE